MTRSIADVAAGSLPPPDLHLALLAWFDAQRRDLPWRRRRSLYGTWISEMMLQQTTVATVAPYWERFVARFPDVAALAAAREEEVLAAWSGLGYYRRARHLHAAARQVVAALDGRLPEDVAGWRDLPGVGPYAAGAIASLGLGLPVAAVDANVRRVLTRWLGPGGPGVGPRGLDGLAQRLVPAERPGDWNEALMELGATVCGPRRADCLACPVSRWCATGRDGPPAPTGMPDRRRPSPVPVRCALLVLRHGERLWLEPAGGPAVVCPRAGSVARDDFARLHQGLLTFPMTAWYAAAEGGAASPQAGPDAPARPGSAAWLPQWHPWPDGTAAWTPVGRFRHAITRYRLAVDVLEARAAAVEPVGPVEPVAAAAPSGRPGGRWVSPAEAGDLALSQLARKALRLLRDG